MTINERKTRTRRKSCQTCRVLEITTCPLLERAVLKGFEYLEDCEMYDVIDKVYDSGKNKINL